MNYYDFLNRKIASNGLPSGYTVTSNVSNPFQNLQNNNFVNVNNASIFTSATKEDLSKIDYNKVIGEKLSGTNETVELSPLEFVLKEFFALDKVKADADKNGDGEISVEEAQNYVNELAAKDGDGEVLSLQDFEALIKEKGIDLDAISNFLQQASETEEVQAPQPQIPSQQVQVSAPDETTQTQPVRSNPHSRSRSRKVSLIQPQKVSESSQPFLKPVDLMTLPELKKEKSKREKNVSDKRKLLASLRTDDDDSLKQAKNEMDVAEGKYQRALNADKVAKRYSGRVKQNLNKIKDNQKAIDKNDVAIDKKKAEITEGEASVTSLEQVLSAMEASLSDFPAPSGKPEDKENDAQLGKRKARLTKDISDKKKEIENQKNKLETLKKDLEALNEKKSKLEEEKKNLQAEKEAIEETIMRTASDVTKNALKNFKKSVINFVKLKSTETKKAETELKEAEQAVVDINNKISAKEVEEIKKENSKKSSDNPVEEAVRLAESQIGVREIGSSNDSPEIRKYKNGAANNDPWCASFASWVYGAGQGSDNSQTFGYTASSQSIKQQAIASGCYAPKNTGYRPQKGDLAMWTKSAGTGHVGVVTEVYSDGSFDVTQGNTGNAVTKKHYKSQNDVDSSFSGFVQMSKWTGVMA